jgi:hypothetical protein
MATSKKKLAEEIQRIYARYADKENIDRSLDSREVKLMIEQAMNKVLKAQTFERFRDGYVDIPRCNLIKYSGITISADASNNRSYAELPALPISLPMDMGVWQINATGSPHVAYIPISAQDWAVMGVGYTNGTQSDGLNASYLEQQTGYYVEGKRIYFTKDISSQSTVDIQLLVSDLSQLTDNDVLPLSPEYEADVIQAVLQMIGLGQISQPEKVANENSNT